MPKSLSVIGAGVVGTAVGCLLRRKGYVVNGVVSRGPGKAEGAVRLIGAGRPGRDPVSGAKGSDWVFITTPDRAIKETCDKIAAGGGFKKGSLAVHLSGALSSEILAKAREAGARALSIHPIQSLASVEQAMDNLPGSYFSMEGDPEAQADGAEIVEALGGRLVVIPSDQKALYHAGAAVASNYLVTVVDYAITIFESLGMGREEALKAVLPLVRGTVNNIEKVGVPGALTGPIARGDTGTVEGHIAVLARKLPDMVRLYCELGKHAVVVGMAKGTLTREEGDRLLDVLNRRIQK